MTDRTRRWLTWLATATAVFPFVLALARALNEGWRPTSDGATVAIRALDVLSVGHHPLIGMLSTVSATTGTIVHHPGPLPFDALALPTRLFGADVGVPLAVCGLNAVCAWWVVSLAGRVGGLAVRLATAVGVALLAWTMTWPVLVDPWNPHMAMLPALLFFVGCGVLTLGERAGLLPAVVGGSLSLQAHLGYVYIVGFTILATLGLWWLNTRPPAARRAPWPRRSWLVAAVVLAALWIQPMIDVIANGRSSNVAATLRAAGADASHLGLGQAIRLVGSVAVPPWWLPGGFVGPTAADPPPPALVTAIALVVVGALLLLIGWRGPTQLTRAFGRFTAVLVPLAVVSVARVPVDPVFGYSAHHWRWLWVLAVLATIVIGWVVVAFGQRHLSDAGPLPAALASGACLGVVVLTVIGAERDRPVVEQEVARIGTLIDGLPFDELSACRRVVVDYALGFEAPGLVGPSVLLALRERDIDFAPTASDAILQLERRPRGDEDCLLSIAQQPGPGRVVGSIDGPLGVTVTLEGTSGD